MAAILTADDPRSIPVTVRLDDIVDYYFLVYYNLKQEIAFIKVYRKVQ